jgi:photosystem II stability/assembly factor-like uncharacterized protein
VLRTDDGGKTWKQQVTGVDVTLFGIGFADKDNGVAVGIDSTILRTEDGGATWKPLPSPFDERAYYEVAIEGQVGWIAGNQGTILVSKDAGKSWQEFHTPKEVWSEWFRGIDLRGDRGFVVGGSGKVYATKGTDAELLNPAQPVAHHEG